MQGEPKTLTMQGSGHALCRLFLAQQELGCCSFLAASLALECSLTGHPFKEKVFCCGCWIAAFR